MMQPDPIARLLDESRTIAVVGLSAKTHRASYQVAAYMQQQGFHIIPVNPREAGNTILGELCYNSLSDAAASYRIDIVDCFRNAEDIPPIVAEAIAIGAACVWMQSGIRHPAAAQAAGDAGLEVVQDRCLKVEHLIRKVHLSAQPTIIRSRIS